jgi:hypothetical protein
MKETNIMKLLMLKCSSLGITIFRNNVGTMWTGSKTQRLKTGEILISDPRPFKAGLCVGSSDLIGWKTVIITPEMVGNKIAVFTAVEVKKPTGKTSHEQIIFMNNIQRAGGISGIATSTDDLVLLIENFKS